VRSEAGFGVGFWGQAAALGWIHVPNNKHFRADAAMEIHSRAEAELKRLVREECHLLTARKYPECKGSARRRPPIRGSGIVLQGGGKAESGKRK